MNKLYRILIPAALTAAAALFAFTSCGTDDAGQDQQKGPGRLIPSVTESETVADPPQTDTGTVEDRTEAVTDDAETTEITETTAVEVPPEETLPQTPPDRTESLALGLCNVFDCFEIGNNSLTERQIGYLSEHSDFYLGKRFTVYGIYEKRIENDVEYNFVLVGKDGYSRAFAVLLPDGAHFENGDRAVMSGTLVRYSGSEKTSLCYAVDADSAWYESEYRPTEPEITGTEPQIMTVATDVTYICQSPNMSSIIAELPNGAPLTVTGVSDYWYSVEYNGKDGYFVPRSSLEIREEDDLTVPKDRTFDPPRKMYITAYTLKIRSTPDFDTEDNVIGYLHKGEEISVTGELEAGFYIFKYDGNNPEYKDKDCYIGRSYVSDKLQYRKEIIC